MSFSQILAHSKSKNTILIHVQASYHLRRLELSVLHIWKPERLVLKHVIIDPSQLVWATEYSRHDLTTCGEGYTGASKPGIRRLNKRSPQGVDRRLKRAPLFREVNLGWKAC